MSVLSPFNVEPPRSPWLAGLGLVSIALVASAYVFFHVAHNGAIGQALIIAGYDLGAYYHVDAFSAYVLLLLSACYLVGLASALQNLAQGVYADNPRAFFLPYFVSFAGLGGAVVVDNLPLLILSLEAACFSFYFMIGYPWQRRALFNTFQYYFLGGLATLLLVAGAGLVHASTGSFNLGPGADGAALDRTGLFGLTLFVFGVLLKIGAFPLHVHLPRIFLHSPPAVVFLFSTAVVVIGVYVLVKLVYSYAGVQLVRGNTPVLQFLALAGLLGILLPSLIACYRDNVRELLTYVMLAQVGYILAALSLADEIALTAGLLHLVAHVLILGSLWLALTQQGPAAVLEGQRALARRRPLMAFCVLVAALSLVGMPLTSGFISKWYLLGAALENGSWVLLAAMVAGILITAAYVWRLVENMYLHRGDEGPPAVKEAPANVLIPLLLLTGANIYLGIDTRWTLGAFEIISANLAGGVQ